MRENLPCLGMPGGFLDGTSKTSFARLFPQSACSINLDSLLESDKGSHIISLHGSRDKVGAKLLFEQLADDLGIKVDIPWNFVPGKIVLIEEEK